VVETETTRLRAAVTALLAPSLGLEASADQLATTLVQKLRAAYPLQGRLLHVTPPTVLVNIGTEQGVTPGMTCTSSTNNSAVSMAKRLAPSSSM
jgi:hypothetical protein